jgi:hypothetical protein
MNKIIYTTFLIFFTLSCGNGISPTESFVSKKISVFGIGVYATGDVEDSYIIHTAKVLAKYLDNDDNGTIDDVNVVNSMIANKACMLITPNADTSVFIGDIPCDFYQDLYVEEIKTSGSSEEDGFDASVEEILHLISHYGYTFAYPKIFGMISYGENNGSAMTNAMDTARGGFANSIPDEYPSGAWYKYTDDSCNYLCQASEYFYWALTTKLGMQEYTGRYDMISSEWAIDGSDTFASTDTTMNAILSKTGAYSSYSYVLPTVKVETTYNSTTFTVETISR